MNITTGKTRDDTPLYRVNDFNPNAISEWLFDLPDEKCRVDLEGVGYLKFDTARERQSWANGYAFGIKVGTPIGEAFTMLVHYATADKEDYHDLDVMYADQLDSMPEDLRETVVKAAIEKLRAT